MMIPPLSSEPATKAPPHPARVCLAPPEFGDFQGRGGIATAYDAFARALAEGGHDVTVLLTGPLLLPPEKSATLIANYAQRKIRIIRTPELPFRCATVDGSGPNVLAAYRILRWLRDQEFDVVHFTEWQAYGYFCLCAKRCGMGFRNTRLCVSTRGPSRWCRQGDQQPISDYSELITDFIEQRSVELADTLIVPSRHIADWMRGEGWKLPESTFLLQNLIRLPENLAPLPASPGVPINEIVFFGRLEPRKGLPLFCDAIDRLDPALLDGKKITFLGRHTRMAHFDSHSFLARRLPKWNAETRILSARSRSQALAHLTRPGVLAVIASELETACNALIECAALQIPFLAAATSAIPELIAEADHSRVLFEPNPADLAEKITGSLQAPPASGRFRIGPDENEKRWISWHDGLATMEKQEAPALPPSPDKVSVCMATHNRPEFLLLAVASIEAQTYPNVEVVIVDDGSTHPDAAPTLDSLEERFTPKGWKIIRQESRYAGAARNVAARAATGRWLMFMDDDDLPKPHEIETFIRAAQASGAQLLTCLLDCFKGNGLPPSSHTGNTWRQLFLGGPLGGAVFQNTLGSLNFLVEREVFLKVGGFSEITFAGAEDLRFLARAMFDGYEILTVPDALYWYRILPGSMFRTIPKIKRDAHLLSLFHQYIHPSLRDALNYANQLHLRNKACSNFASDQLTAYSTVIDDSCKTLGVLCYFSEGWHEDELSRRWTGKDSDSATISIYSPSDAVEIDFSALAEPLLQANRLAVHLNGKQLDTTHRNGKLTLLRLRLQSGLNQLVFTPALPPECPNQEDTRPLGYSFSQITIRPWQPAGCDYKS